MNRGLLLSVLLAIVMPVQANEMWSNLWKNADQQGEQLLQNGDANAAAKVYADPRRIAYAKLKSGDYDGAANDLSNLHDSDADYNRGNALAYAGKLQNALDAYDAALKSDPNNQDARHNREQVANALKQQQQSGNNKSKDDKQDGQQGKNKDSAGQSDHNADKDKNTSAQNNSKQQLGEEQKSKNDQFSEGKQSNQNGSNQSKPKDKAGQDPQKEGTKPTSTNAAQAGQSKELGSAKDDAEQAKRDIETSLAQSSQNGKNAGENNGEANDAKAISAATPKNEQQIAQEQWLRSIPDDPSGLLRRKFLIEHMIRQQKAQQ